MGIWKAISLATAGSMLAVANGCGLVGSGGGTPTAVPLLPVGSWSQVDIPLSRYTLSASDWAVIYSGVVAVQNRCLTRFGLPSAARVPETQPIWKVDTLARRYGIWNREEVAKYGYGMAPSDQSAKPKTTSAQDATIAEVMTGQRADGSASTLKDSTGKAVGEGGCGKEGWDTVRSSGPLNVESLPSQLADESWSRLLTDGRFIDLEGQWSSCMKRSGYQVRHRWETADQVKGQAKKDVIQAAVADLSCAEQVNFVGVANQIDSLIQLELISKHEGELRGTLDAQARLLENAKRAAKA